MCHKLSATCALLLVFTEFAASADPTDSIRATLRSLAPSADRDRQINSLVLVLGGADFAQRESAARKLVEFRALALPQVREAVESDDPELASRARAVLRKININPAPAGLREA